MYESRSLCFTSEKCFPTADFQKPRTANNDCIKKLNRRGGFNVNLRNDVIKLCFFVPSDIKDKKS
jgi:hypothetical protein